MLASWKTSKVIGLDPVAMGFQEIVTAVMCHADARLMAVPSRTTKVSVSALIAAIAMASV